MRYNPGGQIFFVTNRCEEERFFLLPKRNIINLIGAWFGRALALYGDGIELYAFIFLSNHLHILCKDTKGQLSKVMWYFQLNIAKAVNRELGRQGHFFSREYHAAPVLTNEDFEEKYTYTIANAVKAGLVSRADEGPFLSSYKIAVENKSMEFVWFDRTKKHNMTRHGHKVDSSAFEKRYKIKLSTPPLWSGMSKARRTERIRELAKAAEHRYRQERKAEGKGFLGVKSIIAQSSFSRPKDPARSPRVRVFCKDKEKKIEYLTSLKAISGLYREARDGFIKSANARRKKSTVEWPEGCYLPSTMHPVSLAA